MVGTAAVTVGGLIVLVVVWDVLTTTLALGDGAGPVTRRVLGVLWRTSVRLTTTGSRSRVLGNAGPALLVFTVLIWVTAMWAGWWLVFLGSGSIRAADTGAPASAADVAYYAGFSVFTLGVGDFVADSGVWRIVTSVASFAGLALVTLAITYLLSVISAVVSRRSLASNIHALGSTAQEIVIGGWCGGAFAPAFAQHLVALAGSLTLVAQQHFAYPVLHYFRSSEADESAPLAIAVLDDALLLLTFAVCPSVAPHGTAVQPVRKAISRYIRTASTASAHSPDAASPTLPSVARLRDAGIPLRVDPWSDDELTAEADRRRRLQQLVHEANWGWPGS